MSCCPVVIDVHGKNSVILYIPNSLSSSAENSFDVILDVDLSLGMRFFF